MCDWNVNAWSRLGTPCRSLLDHVMTDTSSDNLFANHQLRETIRDVDTGVVSPLKQDAFIPRPKFQICIPWQDATPKS